MESHALDRRSTRSTNAQLVDLELYQSAVIGALVVSGDVRVAARLSRCQDARQTRTAAVWPWRCHSMGCWQCHRAAVRRHWRGYVRWTSGPDSSLIRIPVDGDDPFTAARHIRKAVRDIRDRHARYDQVWASVMMAGMIDGDRALVLVRHDGIEREEIWDALEPRFPDVSLHDPSYIVPGTLPTVEHAAEIARRRRGLEPVRIVIAPQREWSKDDDLHDDEGSWSQPMPICW